MVQLFIKSSPSSERSKIEQPQINSEELLISQINSTIPCGGGINNVHPTMNSTARSRICNSSKQRQNNKSQIKK
ncbi:MAG: hypothetical protein SFU25_06735 [Candidatus Caenarcaniphilales bacterium]|nr:hypothetical protein [Candidatus Caenarcaniphilales bacterium]